MIRHSESVAATAPIDVEVTPEWDVAPEHTATTHDPTSPADFSVSNESAPETAEDFAADASGFVPPPAIATVLENLGNGRIRVRMDNPDGRSIKVVWNGATAGFERETIEPIIKTSITTRVNPMAPAQTPTSTAPAPSMHPLAKPGDHHGEFGESGGERYFHMRATDDDRGTVALHNGMVLGINHVRAKLGEAPLGIEPLPPLGMEDDGIDDGMQPAVLPLSAGYEQSPARGRQPLSMQKPQNNLEGMLDDGYDYEENETPAYRVSRHLETRHLKSILIGSAWFIAISFVTDNIGYVTGHIMDGGVRGLASDVFHVKNPIEARFNPFIGVVDTADFAWKHTLGG